MEKPATLEVPVFLLPLIVGLTGLGMMALPALGRHGGHGAAHGRGSAHAHAAPRAGLTRFVPSPRAIFSLLALYGAFGNALVHAAGQSELLAGLLAVVPALAVERFAVTPLWNLLLRAQGEPSSSLDALLLAEARAVTPFRNGRGMVSVVRDGRHVQFAARLRPQDLAAEIRVGDALWVEAVDPQAERLTVSPVQASRPPPVPD